MERRDNEHGDQLRPSTMAPEPKAPRNELGAHEAYAFWHGMRHRPESLGTGFLAGFLEDIFSIKPRPFFRDARLEAIRRLTICFRQGLSERLTIELQLARRAGVTENQIATLRTRIGQPPIATG